MWPFGMSRQEVEDFLREHAEDLIRILLDAYGMTLDEIMTEHMAEDAWHYKHGTDYWEAC